MADKESDKQTVIGPETRISGELRGDEDVIVRGRVEGRVNITSVFTVEESAIVQADVEARVILISGVVVGNVIAAEIVRLSDKARVVGDINAPRVVIEAGAAFRGRLDMGDIAAGAPASVRTSSRKPAEAGKTAPPRLASPARVAPGSVPARTAPPVPPRPAVPATAARAPAPPPLPRPGTAAAGGIASGSGPSWAKKKLQRRR
jgi:cytoskeletal protein CcmA (bactofilin family)